MVEFSVFAYTSYVENCMDVDQWSYDNAFLYVGSVASTVGYGNVIPKTDDGRKLTIILAIIGIPIYAILLRKINSQVLGWESCV